MMRSMVVALALAACSRDESRRTQADVDEVARAAFDQVVAHPEQHHADVVAACCGKRSFDRTIGCAAFARDFASGPHRAHELIQDGIWHAGCRSAVSATQLIGAARIAQDMYVRARALIWLEDYPMSTEIAHYAVEELDHPEDYVRRTAEGVTFSLGEREVEALAMAMKDPRHDVLLRLLYALGDGPFELHEGARRAIEDAIEHDPLARSLGEKWAGMTRKRSTSLDEQCAEIVGASNESIGSARRLARRRSCCKSEFATKFLEKLGNAELIAERAARCGP